MRATHEQHEPASRCGGLVRPERDGFYCEFCGKLARAMGTKPPPPPAPPRPAVLPLPDPALRAYRVDGGSLGATALIIFAGIVLGTLVALLVSGCAHPFERAVMPRGAVITNAAQASPALSWGAVVPTPCTLNGVPGQGAPGGWLVRINASNLPLDQHPEYFNVTYAIALTNARAECALTKDWPGAEMCDVSPLIGSDPPTYGTQYYNPDESPLTLHNGPLDGLFVIPNDATSPVSITFVPNDGSRGYPITAPSIPYAGPRTIVLRAGSSARPAVADTLRTAVVR